MQRTFNADDTAHEPEGPSKSARKRAAHELQSLGEQLLRLREAELAALELPETLREALQLARRISSRGALARQRQYIGKLMRTIDPEPIRAALAARHAADLRAGEPLRQAEAWRARLLSEGAAALAELARLHPQLNAQEWAPRIARAQQEQAGGHGGAAARELFRALRALFATMP